VNRRGFGTLVGASLVASAMRLERASAQPSVGSAATPSPSFAQASASIRAVIARDAGDPLLEKAALPRFYEHGKAVENAVVLFHGFTNCPQQFDELARQFHDRGCNVYVPRIPYHGHKDRLTRDLAKLTVPELQASATEAYGFARGLGKRVTALGLSLGGSMALYLAQTQPIDLAVPVSPFLMPIGIPDGLGLLAMQLLNFWPDMYWWWDPRVKENCLPVYAYPGYPTHALAECVFLGNSVIELAPKDKPLGRRCTLVTNRNESAVNNNVARKLFKRWQSEGADYGEVVLTGLGVPRHDIIDPTTFPQARTLVYPKLEKIVLD
jgi:carboxylesterase